MKRSYKILSFLLSIVLVMSSITMPSYAAENVTNTVSGNSMDSVSQSEISTIETKEGENSTESVFETVVASETETMEEENSMVETEETIEENVSLEETEEVASEETSEKEASEVAGVQVVDVETKMPSYSEFVINPVYADILDREAVSNELSVVSNQIESYSVSPAATTLTTVDQVVDYVRKQMVARSGNITTVIPYSLFESVSNFSSTVFNEAIEHTEACSGKEGDALYWAWKVYNFNGEGTYDAFTVTWTVTYYTTAAQEKTLNQKVNSIMDELAFTESTSDYDKIKAIHDYICDAVDYDSTYKKYSAYEALCTGSAVCQGYAVACYRLCKEAGLPVRVIAGSGGGGKHGWNIVKIGDVYYNVDCTWDGQTATTYDTWFLLSEIDFVDHTRWEEYSTDAFYKKYPMALYSWGKTFEGFNQDNFTYTFTTLDEEAISSTANGKPKLLIFFRPDCYNSKSTISSLTEYDLEGVDIYAMDSYRNSKETVQAFKETYGGDNIVFSYSTEYANTSPAWKYVKVLDPEAQGYTFPVIAYIDADNKIQHVTTGISDGRQISNYLQLACGYTEQFREYTITYNLDGGSNHPENPNTFTSRTANIKLKAASKNGYTFKGWYSDAEYQTKVTQIPKGTRKNVTLYAKFVKELELTLPSKTIYAVGEKIDLTGGSITHNASNKTSALTNKLISGFSSKEEGICNVEVTYQGCSTTFNVLIVKAPEVSADYGQTLADITLPESEYGTYSWLDDTTILNVIGENTYKTVFTPNDTVSFSVRNDLDSFVKVYRSVIGGGLTTEIISPEGWIYNGYPHKPEVEVYMDGVLLSPDDYVVRYGKNIDAGFGSYWIDGKNYYKDSKGYEFPIAPADLTIKAKDTHLKLGDELPQSWEYTVEGLAENDVLVKEPVIVATVADTSATGLYEIIPSGAEATKNYNTTITYEKGILQISEEKVGYTVTFDVQGHGEAPDAYIGVKAGNIIASPQVPIADGYAFAGWYKDVACKKVWNFATDTVQADTVLYAKWNVVKENISFCVSEIADVTYTGKALKPPVKVYDGETLLKEKKDYTITYHMNTNVNSTKAGNGFDDSLPYVTIVGKGNYTDTIRINFNILPAVIGDGSETPAKGVKLSYSDQLTVNKKKAVNPFKSISLGRSMRKGVDFDVVLTPMNAVDVNGQQLSGVINEGTIPKGSKGTFELTITGKGNYTGSINKTVVVTDKQHLIKNAKITLGMKLKTIDFDYYQNEMKGKLTSAYYDNAKKKYYAVVNGSVDYSQELNAKEVFVVKYGSTSLIEQRDYTVSYQNDEKTGTATMVITGIGNYLGTKTITFALKGRVFSAKTVSVEEIAPQTYTGKPIILNDVQLTYKDGSEDGVPLEYGRDYTISYAKHINKGNATMTFIAKGDSGYQGSFKKNFTIDVAPITSVLMDESMQNISVEYDRAGAKPADKVILKNAAGITLVSGKDYTLSYENNRAVSDKNAENAPTIVIAGKGNYGGDALRVPFTITQASLESSKITVTVKEMAYNSKKVDTYAYRPVVKVMDGKKVLRQDVDYKIDYKYNTQAEYEAYYLTEEEPNVELMPRVIITTDKDSSYCLDGAMEIALPIYQTKITKGNVHVVVSTGEYTGAQVSPDVTVYYSADTKKVKEAKKLTDEEEIRKLGLEKLTEDIDYTASYGKNIVAGNKKGTVTISGKSPVYGGSVTVKFNINSKKIIW